MMIEIVDAAGGREYAFEIDAYTPDTLPMARLAEYMADLARLLGEAADVHFVRLDEGSARLIHRIEGTAVPKVRVGLALLERARVAGVPFSWITGDSVYGADHIVRRWAERHRRGYVLAVTSGQRLGFRPVTTWIEDLPEDAWQRLSAGNGAIAQRSDCEADGGTAAGGGRACTTGPACLIGAGWRGFAARCWSAVPSPS